MLTDKLLGKIPQECVELREKVLRIHKRNFKEKHGPTDRINHSTVKLEIDKSRGIKPVKHSKAYDIPIHLRESAQSEFTEMRKAGIIVESDGEASEWLSLYKQFQRFHSMKFKGLFSNRLCFLISLPVVHIP